MHSQQWSYLPYRCSELCNFVFTDSCVDPITATVSMKLINSLHSMHLNWCKLSNKALTYHFTGPEKIHPSLFINEKAVSNNSTWLCISGNWYYTLKTQERVQRVPQWFVYGFPVTVSVTSLVSIIALKLLKEVKICSCSASLVNARRSVPRHLSSIVVKKYISKAWYCNEDSLSL